MYSESKQTILAKNKDNQVKEQKKKEQIGVRKQEDLIQKADMLKKIKDFSYSNISDGSQNR